jgi:hypothetical protein
VEPTEFQLERLVQKLPSLKVAQAKDPKEQIDNRIAIRILLWKHTSGQISKELLHRLSEPYDNGYYKKSDGKSTPIPWLKMNSEQEHAGIKKDIVSVRHDLDYYRGSPQRLEADLFYLLCQHCIGSNRVLATLEYIVLRIFGFLAWNKHKRKRETILGYGTDEYIKQLPLGAES